MVNFDFDHFVSILNCLTDLEAHRQFYGEGSVHFTRQDIMVFDGDHQDDNNRNNAFMRIQALRAASCVKILGKGVVRVVRRVDDAKENNNLDLSDCQLIQVPDAIYFMMRDTQLTACNLSSNVITKIPPKFPTNFNFIIDLNLSFNKMSSLPEEISKCTQLETVDISHNSFISLPNCLLNLPKITQINARKNFIADVEVELVSTCGTLESLNLEENPLSRDCQDHLQSISQIRILITPRDLEEWEDLSI
jgi:hypothetical protein